VRNTPPAFSHTPLSPDIPYHDRVNRHTEQLARPRVRAMGTENGSHQPWAERLVTDGSAVVGGSAALWLASGLNGVGWTLALFLGGAALGLGVGRLAHRLVTRRRKATREGRAPRAEEHADD
jgi:hypothetical protein